MSRIRRGANGAQASSKANAGDCYGRIAAALVDSAVSTRPTLMGATQ